jgi:hypothetical protein
MHTFWSRTGSEDLREQRLWERDISPKIDYSSGMKHFLWLVHEYITNIGNEIFGAHQDRGRICGGYNDEYTGLFENLNRPFRGG